MKRVLEENQPKEILHVSEELKLRLLLVSRAMGLDLNDLLTKFLNDINAPTISQIMDVTR
jgi:hypothetical protein